MPSDPAPPHRWEIRNLSARARAILEQVDQLAARGRDLGRTSARGFGERQTPHIAGGEPRPDTQAAEASVQALIDAMGERAEAMRETLDELGRSLETLEGRVAAAARRVRAARDERSAAGTGLSSSRARFVRSSDLRPPLVAPTDSARLVAIEMAVAGSTRQAVANRLRAEFAIARPDPLLDDVFGPGTGGEARMPWAQG